MYYGELGIKAEQEKGKDPKLVFYTRKRKNRKLPEGEKFHVGESITMEFSEIDVMKQILLDIFTIVTKGACSKDWDELNEEHVWSVKSRTVFHIMTGPLIIDLVGYDGYAELSVITYTEDMSTEEVGSIRFSDTGRASLVQKLLAALDLIGVNRDEAYVYKKAAKEES